MAARTETMKHTEQANPAAAPSVGHFGLVLERFSHVHLAVVALTLVMLWAYWPTLVGMWRDWQADDNYSVGQLVPLAALYLLWHDRRLLARHRLEPCWWGLPVVLAAMGIWAMGLVFIYESIERYAFVLTITGLVLFLAGRRIFRQTFWILMFLFLMVPLPNRVHNMISDPLQGLATSSAVVTLELLGVVVSQEGHQLLLNHRVPVAVAEACSGLRMLAAFVVVSAVLAYVVNRPRWQRATLLVASIPVAILCNLVRLVVTAVLFLAVSSEVGEKFFHDFAGLTMMPLAVLMLVGLMWIMSRLVIDEDGDPNKAGL
jgi:exosortase